MASVIDSYRTVIYGVLSIGPEGTFYFGPSVPDLAFLLRTGLTALLVLIVGWWFFQRRSPVFGEEV
jgi:hypothetical protein